MHHFCHCPPSILMPHMAHGDHCYPVNARHQETILSVPCCTPPNAYKLAKVTSHLRFQLGTADHVASLTHAATSVHLKLLHLRLSELVELCTTERRRTPNVYLTQLMRTPSHVHTHTRGASHGSMHNMGTVRERDEDGSGACCPFYW